MKIEERIYKLLQESSFPSIVLLDGHWGVGKTYFVKQTLMPYLKNKYKATHKGHYLSLYGVSDLDDFKTRLLSLVYSRNEQTGWFAKRYSGVGDFAMQTLEGTRGVGKALGNVGSIVKQHYFNQLNDRVLFIDDLERLSNENVKSEILGECLNLCENKNIKIVVIGNQGKIEKKADIEKVFSDIVHLSRTPTDLMSVVDQIYIEEETLPNEAKQIIEDMLRKYEVDNIRIIRRAIDRFYAISNLFIRKDELDYRQIDEHNLITSLATCFAIFHHEFSLDEVLQALDENPLIHRRKKGETEQDKRIELLRSLIHPLRPHTTDSHVRYIAAYDNRFKDLETEMKLPVATDDIQEILDYQFRRHDDLWLSERLSRFKQYIDNPKPTDFVNWCRACSAYSFMIENRYIEYDFDEFVSNIKKVFDKFIFESTAHVNMLCRDIGYYVHDSHLRNVISEFLRDKATGMQASEMAVYREQLVQSWQSCAEVTEQKYGSKPFLQHLQKKDFDQMITNWSSGELYDFSSFMYRRYDFSNIEDFLSEELDALALLCECIENERERLPYGAKLGVLTELASKISSIHERLGNNLELKSGGGGSS
ncbi:hypothetical protein CBX98_19715 (plasmid) [Vibrio sp. T9]|uniref:P-loop NTPase fold protein n=1 Tax=Vibrio sp. T9 TaxID=2007196 RepID=UPI000D64697E|nr:P-loop NTPase fold protein [Vibrio sp. T9]PWF69489.1 hypothetical protein CBX98_19715 [Vibrio sp. T9]